MRRNTRLPSLALLCSLVLPVPALSQIKTEPFADQRIESVHVAIVNPGTDAALHSRIEDLVRRTVAAYPSSSYSEERLTAALARLSRVPEIKSVQHQLRPGATGGVVLELEVSLAQGGSDAGAPAPVRFPNLYQSNGTLLRAKVETLAMYYGNHNAWFGRSDLMLNGNPFAVGQAAGKGYSQWLEGFVHGGLYGITPLTDTLYLYGGLSAIASGSVGQELFTDKTRSHVAFEDAFVGLVGGSTSAQGDRLVYNLSAGRQRFSIGEGMILVNTAMNGLNRAALQSNPRWAADQVALARLAYNDWKLEAFHVDPDELPEVDSKTRIQGINLETTALQDFSLGLTALRVPKSQAAYYTTTSQLQREGLRALDLRLRWQPQSADGSGPFVAAEAARQSHSRFDMRAQGYYGELGYVFAKAAWSPVFSYRYARFTGDKPETSRFERWDPLLSGGNGETWVQGINHFKIFQDSNLIAHRFQARLRPRQNIELVPQYWVFRADSLTNLGGNPALSLLPSRQLGSELNLTFKYFMSRNIMFQGHVAATYAGSAVEQALGQHSSPWISTMIFVRVGY
ncbi:alginate export family protein [Roseateles sp.]|uniref:alginate export family protein n=1 Tax=Roseateles sp. TaxID=1971397 RepID=UPI00391A115A